MSAVSTEKYYLLDLRITESKCYPPQKLVFFSPSNESYLWTKRKEGGLKRASFICNQALTGIRRVFLGLMTGKIGLMRGTRKPVIVGLERHLATFGLHSRGAKKVFRRKMSFSRHA